MDNQGQDVITYSKSIVYYILDLVERYFRNLHEQMAWQANLMTKAYPSVINVC